MVDIDVSYIERNERLLEFEVHGSRIPEVRGANGSAFSAACIMARGPWTGEGHVSCSDYDGMCPDTDFLLRETQCDYNATPWVRDGYIGWYWWSRQRGDVPTFVDFVAGGIGVVK